MNKLGGGLELPPGMDNAIRRQDAQHMQFMQFHMQTSRMILAELLSSKFERIDLVYESELVANQRAREVKSCIDLAMMAATEHLKRYGIGMKFNPPPEEEPRQPKAQELHPL